ncbi:hypothetical protein AKJ52_00435 [candidate division MSBL1 archaeon SCGC-AAA382C18]|uniref:Uncharacterized protein n=1 Tax=candidate division MSBL1 archaeon SCGC-AAA382C18 TaxID=1698281 RepID=A0A133VLR2_9EURY|nr:hypothetical protein AKJ52_00435 [candidate division MSBL1 archaeon SCGC-AAA382C18]
MKIGFIMSARRTSPIKNACNEFKGGGTTSETKNGVSSEKVREKSDFCSRKRNRELGGSPSIHH